MALRGTERFVAQNRRARHDYHIEESIEAGMQLAGTEVKVLRQGLASINEAYATEREGDIYLVNAHSPNIRRRASITSRAACASCCCAAARSTG